MDRIFFTADLHFGDRTALRHLPDRPYSHNGTTCEHDRWLADLWCRTVRPADTVYILGDVCAYPAPDADCLLDSLPGRKVLIWGNHDPVMRDLKCRFVTCGQLFDKRFSGRCCPEFGFPLSLVMCHYPLLTWKAKPQGALMIHGHCHGRLDDVNAMCPDLRWDVGIDSALSRRIGLENGDGFALVDLQSLYGAAVEKAGGTDLKKYVGETYMQDNPPELFSVSLKSRGEGALHPDGEYGLTPGSDVS